MAKEPSEDELRLVTEHGTSSLTRALAAVRLARRDGRTDDLRELIEEVQERD